MYAQREEMRIPARRDGVRLESVGQGVLNPRLSARRHFFIEVEFVCGL